MTKCLHQQYRDVFRKQDFLLIISTMKKQNKATFRNSRCHSIKLHIQTLRQEIRLILIMRSQL